MRCMSCMWSEREDDMSPLLPNGPFTLKEPDSGKLRARGGLCEECIEVMCDEYDVYNAHGKKMN